MGKLILFLVEVEGFEPSSNHGPNKLSTCLAIDLIFVVRQARGHQSTSYPLNLRYCTRKTIPDS